MVARLTHTTELSIPFFGVPPRNFTGGSGTTDTLKSVFEKSDVSSVITAGIRQKEREEDYTNGRPDRMELRQQMQQKYSTRRRKDYLPVGPPPPSSSTLIGRGPPGPVEYHYHHDTITQNYYGKDGKKNDEKKKDEFKEDFAEALFQVGEDGVTPMIQLPLAKQVFFVSLMVMGFANAIRISGLLSFGLTSLSGEDSNLQSLQDTATDELSALVGGLLYVFVQNMYIRKERNETKKRIEDKRQARKDKRKRIKECKKAQLDVLKERGFTTDDVPLASTLKKKSKKSKSKSETGKNHVIVIDEPQNKKSKKSKKKSKTQGYPRTVADRFVLTPK